MTGRTAFLHLNPAMCNPRPKALPKTQSRHSVLRYTDNDNNNNDNNNNNGLFQLARCGPVQSGPLLGSAFELPAMSSVRRPSMDSGDEIDRSCWCLVLVLGTCPARFHLRLINFPMTAIADDGEGHVCVLAS